LIENEPPLPKLFSNPHLNPNLKLTIT